MARRVNRKTVRPQVSKPRKHETLEDRVVMSADPLGGPTMTTHDLSLDDEPMLNTHGFGGVSTAIVESAPVHDPGADFWFDGGSAFAADADDLGRRVEQTLNDAHALTGQDEVLTKYGFDGSGQTVVVIDTGIAANHYALGGGVGSGYRVVGGWDFTENDANFYDDGPEGGHGTHVAGIVGAQGDGIHSGVATGVDLVGLRVFDDAGNGYFSWVEQALDWVHTNKDAFNNPITAVNLSLGTEWNSDSIPNWATLEDEFAALEAAGIFISVSAGNSFTDYNVPGVSYPAASDHVIPVMSTDNNGSLSFFSQRAEYAIAAPGRWITSTVPDYAANDGDTIDDDWLSMSGTSMAAPYVAGASVLIREAMSFVGQNDVDQWDIYNHMMDTADTFYDSATDAYYKRLNLEAAIDAILPEDDFGSSVATAHSLGTLNEGAGLASLSTVSGVISTLDDADYFTFTAGVTGVVRVDASNMTHDLTASWDAWGGEWSTHEGGCVLEVIAGQTYTIAFSSSDGLGYYDLNLSIESTFSAIAWGTAGVQQTQSGLSVSGEQWYEVTAGRTGYFTAEAFPQAGSATIAIYDAQQNLLASDASRADVQATAGDTLLLRVTGDSNDLDVRLTNALTVTGGAATLVGTTGNDTVTFDASGPQRSVTLNGVGYQLGDAASLSFDGDGGSDRLTVTGSADQERVVFSATGVGVSSAAYSLNATGFENVLVDGGAGRDTATFNDTAGNDTYVGWSDRAVLYGSGYFHDVRNFEVTTANSNAGGRDLAHLYDSAGDDKYVGWSHRAAMYGDDYFNDTLGFDVVTAYSTAGGRDSAIFNDTAGNDKYVAWSDRAAFYGSGYFLDALNFEITTANATQGGYDVAVLFDSAGADTYVGWHDRSALYGSGYFNDARGFDAVTAHATAGGNDTAVFYDTSGADTYVGWSTRSVMYGNGYFNDVRGFESTLARFTGGGYDRAAFVASSEYETLTTGTETATVVGETYTARAEGFGLLITNESQGDFDEVQPEVTDSAFAEYEV